jgi:hypothetical protein
MTSWLKPFSAALALLALCPAMAQAAAIVNLTETPQEIVLIDRTPQEMVTLAPGGKLDRPGALELRYKGRDVRIEDEYEYAIWPGDTLGPQRKRTGSRKF